MGVAGAGAGVTLGRGFVRRGRVWAGGGGILADGGRAGSVVVATSSVGGLFSRTGAPCAEHRPLIFSRMV